MDGRRKVLGYISGFLGTCAVVTAGAPILGFLSAPIRRKLPSRELLAGDAASLPEGEFKLVTMTYDDETGYTTSRRSMSAYLKREGEKILALSPICTHLRCNVAWDGRAKSFLCPCHGGMFDAEGNVTKGPPVEPLYRFKVETRGAGVRLFVPDTYKG